MEQEYEAGLPSKPGAVVFPKGIDIETKIEALEDRRRTLWFLCPEKLREEYVYGKAPKLVRIVLNHLSSEYRHDVNRMLDIHKVQLEVRGQPVPSELEIEGYQDEWLPEWKTLRECLLKTKEALGNDDKQVEALPTMFTSSSSTSGQDAKHRRRGPQCCCRRMESVPEGMVNIRVPKSSIGFGDNY